MLSYKFSCTKKKNECIGCLGFKRIHKLFTILCTIWQFIVLFWAFTVFLKILDIFWIFRIFWYLQDIVKRGENNSKNSDKDLNLMRFLGFMRFYSRFIGFFSRFFTVFFQDFWDFWDFFWDFWDFFSDFKNLLEKSDKDFFPSYLPLVAKYTFNTEVLNVT